MTDPLTYVLFSLRRAAEHGYPWSIAPHEATALVEECHQLRLMAEEAARAENLNAQDLHEERSRRDAFLKALHEELTLVEAHNLLLSTVRLRELCEMLAPPPQAR
jgi:hypothetical protein